MDTKLANNQEKFRNKISYCFSEIAVFVCMGTFLAAPCDIRSVDTRPVVCKRPLIAVVLSCLPGFYVGVLYPPLWPACLVLRCHNEVACASSNVSRDALLYALLYSTSAQHAGRLLRQVDSVGLCITYNQ